MNVKASIQVETIVQTINSSDVKCMAVSPDGKYLATGGDDLIVKLRDLQSGLLLRTVGNNQRNCRKRSKINLFLH